MPDADQTPSASQTTALVAALLAALVLWLYRDTAGPETALRLIMPVLWLAVWSLACLGTGVWAVRVLLGADDAPRLEVVLAAGAAAFACVGAIAAAVGFFGTLAVRLVVALAAMEGLRLLLVSRVRPRLPAIALVSCPGILMVAAGALTAAVLTTPPVMFDALNYHLAFPARWLGAGGFVEFPRHFFSYYPSAHGALYTSALATVGPWGAAAIHWWMGALAVLAAGTLGERLAGPRAATWSAACFALTPVTLEVAGFAIADLAVAAWAGAALVVLLSDDARHRPWRAGALAGALAGSAAAAKYLALATVVVPVGLAAIVLVFSVRPRRIGTAVALALAAAVALAPWLARNAAWTGNPVYPYLQSVLGGPPCERDLARELDATELDVATPSSPVVRTVTAPIVRTFHPLKSGGRLGPQWLILLPVALMLPGLRGRTALALWVAAAAGTLAWGATVHYARFMLPVLVPAAALAGTAAAALVSGTRSRLIGSVFAVLMLGIFGWNLMALATDFQLDRVATVAGQLPDDDFRNRWVSYGPAITTINEELPNDAVILLVGEPRSTYIDRTVLVEDPYRTPWLVDLARGCTDPSELAARVSELGATHVLVNSSEMDFYGGLRSKPDYWADATPPERLVIERFLAEDIRPILRTDTLLLGEINPTNVRTR